MAGQEGFSAPRRHADADVGHLRIQTGVQNGNVGPQGLVVGNQRGLEGFRRPSALGAFAEELPERIEDAVLIVLENKHGSLSAF